MRRPRRTESRIKVWIPWKGKTGPRPKPIFRDWHGRFVSPKDRYIPDKVALVQAWQGINVNARYVDIIRYTKVTPENMARLMTVDDYESLPATTKPLKSFKPKGKYQAWDIAEQIDKASGLRRKELRVTMEIQDGRQLKKVVFYTKIKANQKRSYQLFTQMNQAIGVEKMHFYNRVGGKLMADRTGKKVVLKKVTVDQMIV